jgi:hypothetical protein
MDENTTNVLGEHRRLSELQKRILNYLVENRGLEKLVRWETRDFLGETPSANQRSAISRSVAFLARRGYVERHVGGGAEKPKTTHLSLTRAGSIIIDAQPSIETLTRNCRKTYRKLEKNKEPQDCERLEREFRHATKLLLDALN